MMQCSPAFLLIKEGMRAAVLKEGVLRFDLSKVLNEKFERILALAKAEVM
jgi:hypothetical protein